jgi:tetratricopeptide (TPR) repeat protein
MKRLIPFFVAFAAPFAAQAQTEASDSLALEEQKLLCNEARSLYSSYEKQEDYHEAYIQWGKACEICPEEYIESVYSAGIRLLEEEYDSAETAENEARMTSCADSIFMLYDRRLELHANDENPEERFELLGRKAVSYYKLRSDDPVTANGWFMESIAGLKEQSSAAVLTYGYLTSFYSLKKLDDEAAKAKRQAMLTEYLVYSGYAEAQLAAAQAEGKDRSVKTIDKTLANLEKVFVAIAKCEDMVPVLQQKVEETPDDLQLKKDVLKLLNKKECIDNDLFLPVATAVHAVEPSVTSAYVIASEFKRNDQFEESFEYIKQALELCGDCAEREQYLFDAGEAALVLNQFNTAKSYARDMLALNANSAEAYILIGNAIMNGATACNDGALGTRLAYLVAADYYGRAKGLAEGDLAEAAGKKLTSASKQFPTREDVFNVGKSVGETIQVPSIGGCPCAGESTTIRIR